MTDRKFDLDRYTKLEQLYLGNGLIQGDKLIYMGNDGFIKIGTVMDSEGSLQGKKYTIYEINAIVSKEGEIEPVGHEGEKKNISLGELKKMNATIYPIPDFVSGEDIEFKLIKRILEVKKGKPGEGLSTPLPKSFAHILKNDIDFNTGYISDIDNEPSAKGALGFMVQKLLPGAAGAVTAAELSGEVSGGLVDAAVESIEKEGGELAAETLISEISMDQWERAILMNARSVHKNQIQLVKLLEYIIKKDGRPRTSVLREIQGQDLSHWYDLSGQKRKEITERSGGDSGRTTPEGTNYQGN